MMNTTERNIRGARGGRILTAAASGLMALSGMVAGAGLLAITPMAMASADDNLITKENVIEGTMDIDFATRLSRDTSGKLKEGSPALGVKDTYRFNLSVVETTQFTGTINRQPNLYSKLIQKNEQRAQLQYAVDLIVKNPKDLKQSKNIGRWVGVIPIDEATGAYDLSSGREQDRALRMKVEATGKASAFEDFFGGRMMGRTEKKDTLAASTYKRIIGDKTVQVTIKRSDPMRFEGMILAKGPADTYPKTTVNGRLDFDYETSNYFSDGIKFRYALDGKDYEDTITGSIKWVEDADRKSNGKGYYEFNLRFNEDKNKTAKGEGAAFEKMSDEDAFFAVDNTIPCLTGRISYVDVMIPGKETPSSSKVTYALNANKLTKQQIMNFFKLWMICVGPTNDE
jgi:hypothetical protein